MSADIMGRLQASLGERYRVERELGGGGMSRVFLAHETSLDRAVVIKLLPPELAQAVSAERFRQEIRLAARLSHPHIVPLLSAGETDGLLYYTMPFIEGESLRARLTREGELPVRNAVRILRDIMAALAYAHEHGVVHRDIKPDNVLLTDGEALVADFGVAKALSASATDSGAGLTSLGVALGTPVYMAPEQGAADPHVDHRADIYAFGCLAYEVLTGHPPFAGRAPASLLAAHATEPPEPIERRRPALPPTLAAVVMRCLEKRAADRPQGAGEVLQALEAIATPIGGTEPTRALPRQRASLGGSRRLAVFWAGLATLVAVGVVAMVWTRGASDDAGLDADLVAVAPFDALGPGLDVWREGFVDLLSRNLDGAGSLRTVSPTVVIRRWSNGRSDPASAAELGRATGAGLAVYGTLVASGKDSVRLSASVLDVQHGESVGEAQLSGDVHRMDALSDSLTVALLRELGRTRPIVAVRTAGLRATSLPALKAFLEGERHYRRGDWDSANAAYERTLALDSAFVPALRHLALSLSWRRYEGSVLYKSYILRAAALNRGLPRRDSILLTADSNFVALNSGEDSLAPDVRRSIVKRLFGTLADATRLYSDDPEAWHALGEARMHLGHLTHTTIPEMLEAFDRAIELDSSFGSAWVHAIELAPVVRGVEGWDKYLRPYLARVKVPAEQEFTLRMIDRLLHPDSGQTARTDSLLRSAPAARLVEALFLTYRLLDSGETAVRLSRELATRKPPTRADSLRWSQYIVTNLAYRGHVREAARLIPRMRNLVFVTDLASELALTGALPAATADSIFGEGLDRDPLWLPGSPPIGGGPSSIVYALPWWAARRDTNELRRFAGRVDTEDRSSMPAGQLEWLQVLGGAVPAYVALARGDTSAAIRHFAGLPRDLVTPPALERLTEGVLLARRGRDADALEVLDQAFPEFWASPFRIMAHLETARAAEGLGQRERAMGDYQRVIDAWRHADPELQPHVEEARAALARLASEES
jgi:tRNA A-37 threonylcarbamoyl transferase component Bud32/tetratricopeptide (TPR) repeat protein